MISPISLGGKHAAREGSTALRDASERDVAGSGQALHTARLYLDQARKGATVIELRSLQS